MFNWLRKLTGRNKKVVPPKVRPPAVPTRVIGYGSTVAPVGIRRDETRSNLNSAPSTDDGFVTSAAIGYITNNGLLGGALGGNFVGGYVGSTMRGDAEPEMHVVERTYTPPEPSYVREETTSGPSSQDSYSSYSRPSSQDDYSSSGPSGSSYSSSSDSYSSSSDSGSSSFGSD